MRCYEEFKRLGFKYIAVGGLLRRRDNTVRFPYVGNHTLMFNVLQELRKLYPRDWLFALGCLHPSRLEAFKNLEVWADYKGWIFQYKKKNEVLAPRLEVLSSNHLEHVKGQGFAQKVSKLQQLIAERHHEVSIESDLGKKLIDGRRKLRAEMKALHRQLQEQLPEMASRLSAAVTHGLLDDNEERIIGKVLQSIGKNGTDEEERIVQEINKNRELKEKLKISEDNIDRLNMLVAQEISRLNVRDVNLSVEMINYCEEIVRLVNKTERQHRFEQVRAKIEDSVLARLSKGVKVGSAEG
jgi:hypothetical protein